jgi:hypothetical protein
LIPRNYFKIEGFIEPFWDDADSDLVYMQELCWNSCFGHSRVFNIKQCSEYGENSFGVFTAVTSIKERKGQNWKDICNNLTGIMLYLGTESAYEKVE